MASSDNTEPLHVAVAVIEGADGKLLIARRSNDQHMGGYWEFPGGKVEVGESAADALNRELEEELGIRGRHFRKLISVPYRYPDRSVLLDTFWVRGIDGVPDGREGQPIQWVDRSSLRTLPFPPANRPIINAVLLPDRYMVTGHFEHESTLYDKVASQLSLGVRLVQFRADWLDAVTYKRLSKKLAPLCRAAGASLILKGEYTLLGESWCDGLHLKASQLQQGGAFRTCTGRKQWLGASCHNEREIEWAVASGVDFVTLSPIRKTDSHPEAPCIGWERAERMTRLVPLPVYWLGGMRVIDLEQVIESGGQGIAAVSDHWAGI